MSAFYMDNTSNSINPVAYNANITLASITCNESILTLPDEVLLRIIQCIFNKTDFLSLSLVSRRIGTIAQCEFYRHIRIPEPTIRRENGVVNPGNSDRLGLLLSTLRNNLMLAQCAKSFCSSQDSMDNLFDHAVARDMASLAVDEGIGPVHIFDLPPTRGSGHHQEAVEAIVDYLLDVCTLYQMLIDLVILQLPNLEEVVINLSESHFGIFTRASPECLRGLKDRLPRLRQITVTYLDHLERSNDGLPVWLGSLLHHVPKIVEIHILNRHITRGSSSILELDTNGANRLDYSGHARAREPQYPQVTKLHFMGGVLSNQGSMILTDRFPAVTDFTFVISPTSNDDDNARVINLELPTFDISRALRGWSAQLQRLELIFLRFDTDAISRRRMINEAKNTFRHQGQFDKIQQLTITVDNVTLYKDRQSLDLDADYFPRLPRLSPEVEEKSNAEEVELENVWLFPNPAIYQHDTLRGYDSFSNLRA